MAEATGVREEDAPRPGEMALAFKEGWYRMLADIETLSKQLQESQQLCCDKDKQLEQATALCRDRENSLAAKDAEIASLRHESAAAKADLSARMEEVEHLQQRLMWRGEQPAGVQPTPQACVPINALNQQLQMATEQCICEENKRRAAEQSVKTLKAELAACQAELGAAKVQLRKVARQNNIERNLGRTLSDSRSKFSSPGDSEFGAVSQEFNRRATICPGLRLDNVTGKGRRGGAEMGLHHGTDCTAELEAALQGHLMRNQHVEAKLKRQSGALELLMQGASTSTRVRLAAKYPDVATEATCGRITPRNEATPDGAETDRRSDPSPSRPPDNGGLLFDSISQPLQPLGSEPPSTVCTSPSVGRTPAPTHVCSLGSCTYDMDMGVPQRGSLPSKAVEDRQGATGGLLGRRGMSASGELGGAQESPLAMGTFGQEVGSPRHTQRGPQQLEMDSSFAFRPTGDDLPSMQSPEDDVLLRMPSVVRKLHTSDGQLESNCAMDGTGKVASQVLGAFQEARSAQESLGCLPGWPVHMAPLTGDGTRRPRSLGGSAFEDGRPVMNIACVDDMADDTVCVEPVRSPLSPRGLQPSSQDSSQHDDWMEASSWPDAHTGSGPRDRQVEVSEPRVQLSQAHQEQFLGLSRKHVSLRAGVPADDVAPQPQNVLQSLWPVHQKAGTEGDMEQSTGWPGVEPVQHESPGSLRDDPATEWGAQVAAFAEAAGRAGRVGRVPMLLATKNKGSQHKVKVREGDGAAEVRRPRTAGEWRPPGPRDPSGSRARAFRGSVAPAPLCRKTEAQPTRTGRGRCQ